MKRTNWMLATVAGLTLTAAFPTFAQNRDRDDDRDRREVRLNELPDEARQAIRREADGKEVKDVFAVTRGNETFYRARIDDRGADRWVQVGRDGKVQKESDADRREEVRLNSIPEDARRTFQREAQGRDIKNVYAIHRGNETLYEARIDDKGVDRVLHVGRDGKVQDVTTDRGRNANDGRDNRDARDREPVRLSDRRPEGRRDRRASFEGWTKDRVDPDRLPGQVKQALGENDVKLNQLSEAWMNKRENRTVYHVIEKGPTRDTHYVVDSNGKFLGEDNVTPEGRDRIEFDRLPGEVKATLQRSGKPNDFRRIVAVTDNGTTWYEARHENGNIIRVGRDGNLVDRDGDIR